MPAQAGAGIALLRSPVRIESHQPLFTIMKQLYNALITNGITYECIADEEQGVQPGDTVILRCERYLDSGRIIAAKGEPFASVESFEKAKAAQQKGRHMEGLKTPVVERKATENDLATIAENERRVVWAHEQTRQRILAHGLPMKLTSSHYSFDRRVVLFQFSAEGRVDFRELLRDLTATLHARIELRQIGVRDEAAQLGGLGTCGRPFCCSRFLHSFNSINVKMAKQQGISLNPQNISGCCGRLKCCLPFEADMYKNVPVSAKERNAAQKTEKASDEAALEALDNAEEDAQKQTVRPPHRPVNNNAQSSRNGRRNGGSAAPRPAIPKGAGAISPSQAGHAPVAQGGELRRERNAARHERHLRQAMQSQQAGQPQQGQPLRGIVPPSGQLPLPGAARPPRLSREERRALRQAHRQQHSAEAPPNPPQE